MTCQELSYIVESVRRENRHAYALKEFPVLWENLFLQADCLFVFLTTTPKTAEYTGLLSQCLLAYEGKLELIPYGANLD